MCDTKNRLTDDYSCELANKYIAGFFVFILLNLLISASIVVGVRANWYRIVSNGHRLRTHADQLDKGPRFTSDDWAKHQAVLTNRIRYLETAVRDHMITCAEDHMIDDFVKPDSVHYDYIMGLRDAGEINGTHSTNESPSGVP